jgi:ribonuclease J
VRERRKLAVVGLVAVAFAVGRKGEILGQPIVELDGVPHKTPDGEPMEERVLDALEGTIKSIPPARRRDIAMLTEAVRRAVRAAIDDVWGKKPIVKVMISEVG